MSAIQHVLRRELTSRQLRNEQFSLRAFARFLDMSPSKLSDVMRGKQSLSLATARQIAIKLALSDAEARAFCDTAIAQIAGIPVAKKNVVPSDQYAEICAFKQEYQISDMEHRLFGMISHWCPIFNSLMFVHRLLYHVGQEDFDEADKQLEGVSP